MDAKLKPYFDALLAHVPAGNYYAGFKLLRQDEDEPEKENESQDAAADPAESAAAPSSPGTGSWQPSPAGGLALGSDQLDGREAGRTAALAQGSAPAVILLAGAAAEDSRAETSEGTRTVHTHLRGESADARPGRGRSDTAAGYAAPSRGTSIGSATCHQ